VIEITEELRKIIESKDKTQAKIKFKNGNVIEIIKFKERGDNVRGKRAEFKHWGFDYEALLDKNMIDEILRPYIVFDDKVVKKCEPILYCSSAYRKRGVENMFETVIFKEPRKTCLREEQQAESLKQEIIKLLRNNNVSLSQARCLFDEIIIQIEDSPIN
jgi:hypothetical protein